MITLEQFEKAVKEQKHLYAINDDFTIDEFRPRHYGVSVEGEYHTEDVWPIKYTVGTTGFQCHPAERCFETMNEARSELKAMLQAKLRWL